MQSNNPNPAYRRAMEIMESAIDEPQWTEKRLAFFSPSGKLFAVCPTNVAYSGVAYLKKHFNLTDRIVEVTVTIKEIDND